MKKIKAIFGVMLMLLCLCGAASAEELTANSFSVVAEVENTEGKLIPDTLRFNLFTTSGEWLAHSYGWVEKSGTYTFSFDVPEYKIGTEFIVVPTMGAEGFKYYDKVYGLEDEMRAETYAFRNDAGELIISDRIYIDVYMKTERPKTEEKIITGEIKSETPYTVWVSKANFRVNVYLSENGQTRLIKSFPCSIGAPLTPTITGQYKYYQYQPRWSYSGYYVGPVMRFYGGYAIHSTLVNNDGTDRDGRVGKMISHGCVRVRPNDMQWLADYVSMGSTIYITEE